MTDFSTIIQSPYYYFNISSLIPFVFFSIAFFFALFVLGLGTRLSFHRSIFYFYMSSALWFLGFALGLSAWVDSVTFFWGRVIFLSMVLVPATLLHLSIVVTNQYKKKKYFLWIVYFGVFLFLIKSWVNPFFTGIVEYPWGFSPKAQGVQWVFLAFSFFCFTYALLNILRHYFEFIKSPQRRRSDLSYRRKLEFVMAAFVLTTLSNVTILNNHGIGIYPLGPLCLFFSIVIMSYALVKYHNVSFLLEIRKMGTEVRLKGVEAEAAKQEAEEIKLKLVDVGKASIFASLSAGILHQICQPITATHGLVKFMRNDMKEDDPYYKTVDLIFEQSTYIKEMLSDLMDLMRHKEVKREYIDVNDCIDRALRLLKDEFRIKRVNWDFDREENLPKVYADAIHLQEMFMNISVNALDAMSDLPKGEKRYIKMISGFDSSANEVFIIFENTGPTLSDEQMQYIFEPFVSNREKGTGIGLALCRDLISDHGGIISVENMEGKEKGVRFYLRFPVSKSSQNEH
ncbi:MAG: ATP-binding protein [Candidatus Aceula lacicola]|nr:ATP-binding protein [Candidatus Aceula lacicola]